jgi:hypothetical protein
VSNDYEYDSAHEATTGPNVTLPPERRCEVQVDTPVDDSGDYNYDMAHDMRTE